MNSTGEKQAQHGWRGQKYAVAGKLYNPKLCGADHDGNMLVCNGFSSVQILSVDHKWSVTSLGKLSYNVWSIQPLDEKKLYVTGSCGFESL